MLTKSACLMGLLTAFSSAVALAADPATRPAGPVALSRISAVTVYHTTRTPASGLSCPSDGCAA